ncbi:MAG: sigma-70 family RNA polymerase sigma factor [Beijerinckiaceae bacterium]
MVGRAEAGAWESLMRAGLAGDAASYRLLLVEITPFVRSVVRRSYRSGGLAVVEIEDVVQDVLLAVHLKRHTWDPALPLAPWLGAVTRHKTIDALRRSGSRLTIPVDELADVLADSAPSEPASGDVERMLSALPDKQRRIVQAMTLDERSAADIGGEMGMSEGAVRVALHRALKSLAGRFGADRA